MEENIKTESTAPKTRQRKAAAKTDAAPAAKVVKKYNADDLITVKSAVSGELIYTSLTASGSVFIWGDVGETCEVPYSELMVMRNTQRSFFEKNWITMSRDVLEQLGVASYYSDAIDFDNIDDVFTYSPEKIKSVIALMSAENKTAVANHAKERIRHNELDSVSVIRTLESALNVDLL